MEGQFSTGRGRRRSSRGCWPIRLAMIACLSAAASAVTEAAGGKQKDDTPPTVLKTRDGLRFELPADWPVEKRGGVVTPMPIEAYLSKKFTALEARLQSLEQQVSGLDVRVRVLEESVKRQSSMQSRERSAATP